MTQNAEHQAEALAEELARVRSSLPSWQYPTRIGTRIRSTKWRERAAACVRAALAMLDGDGPRGAELEKPFSQQRHLRALHVPEKVHEQGISLALGVDIADSEVPNPVMQLNLVPQSFPTDPRWVSADTTPELPSVPELRRKGNPVSKTGVLVAGRHAPWLAATLLRGRSLEAAPVAIHGSARDLRKLSQAAKQLKIPPSLWREHREDGPHPSAHVENSPRR